MKYGLRASVLLLIFSSFSRSQEVPRIAADPPDTEVRSLVEPDGAPRQTRFRASADYLMWWMKKQPIATPLVTLASPADTAAIAAFQPVPAGAITQPNTLVLAGDGPVDLGAFNGMRLSASLALDAASLWSVEGNYFAFERRQSFFNPPASLDGSVVYARPLFDTVGAMEMAELDALPGVFTGAPSVTTSSRLFGWEINLNRNLARSSGFRWDVIAGFRALDLTESIGIRDNLSQLMMGSLTFLGTAIPDGSSLNDFDSFAAANHFYGPQIGTRFDWTSDMFHVSLSTKLAMGVTDQVVTINGGTTLVGPTGNVLANAPGGVLALPTNMGRYNRDQFAIVPEVGLNVGIRITPLIEARVGYTFLYWSSVVHPGSQIDHSVNTSLVPTDPTFGMATGANRPAANISSGDFWAQGINFGLEINF